MPYNYDSSPAQQALHDIFFQNSAEAVAQVGNGDENAKQFHGLCEHRLPICAVFSLLRGHYAGHMQ